MNKFNARYSFVIMTIQLYYYTVICSMFRGGYLGLSWGLPGGFLGVRRGTPIGTPNKSLIKSHRFLIIVKMSA